MNRPCEVGDPGTKVYENASYAVPVFGISGRFDGQGIFDVNLPGCPLENGRQTNLSRYDKRVPEYSFFGGPTEIRDNLVWTGRLSGNGYRYYRYKIGLEAQTDCRDQSGYSAPIDLQDSPVIAKALPPEDQSYRVCIQGGDSAATADTWYQSNFPTVVHFNVGLSSCMVTLMGYFQPLKSQVGVDEFPSRFDPVNKGTCDFLMPVESVTVKLLREGKITATDTLVLNATTTSSFHSTVSHSSLTTCQRGSMTGASTRQRSMAQSST